MSKTKTFAAAALAGLMGAAVLTAGVHAEETTEEVAPAEKNACKGANGCEGHDKAEDKNACKGANGCEGHDKKEGKNACKGANGCEGKDE